MSKQHYSNGRFRCFRRGKGNYYSVCTSTGKQRSLGTKNRDEAEVLINEMNDARKAPLMQRARAIATLKVCDPLMATRTWGEVMERLSGTGQPQTRSRKIREFKNSRYDRIRDKPLINTTAEDFFAVLEKGRAATNCYLKQLQNLAVGYGWLSAPIIPPKLWKKNEPAVRRGITRSEHERIIKMEQNPERNLYYQLLWHTGAAQSDCAEMTVANIDWDSRVLAYVRKKTGNLSKLAIGAGLEQVLRQLPSKGPLFPNIGKTITNARAAEFSRRRKLAGLSGISLHSYRYAWAERAKLAGLSERECQAALGHECVAVHRHYAKGADLVCPALD